MHLKGVRGVDSRTHGTYTARILLGLLASALFFDFAGVAQLVEHLICNQGVAGSSPIASSNFQRYR